MAAPFFLFSAFVVANNKLNAILSPSTAVYYDEDEDEEGMADFVHTEDKDVNLDAEYDQNHSATCFRRIDSDFSLGMNRNKSVDDLLHSLDLCAPGKTALMLFRFASYSLLVLAVGGLVG